MRPAGRSGWVNTAPISWPASSSANRLGTANSELPAKMRFMVMRSERAGEFGRREWSDCRGPNIAIDGVAAGAAAYLRLKKKAAQ